MSNIQRPRCTLTGRTMNPAAPNNNLSTSETVPLDFPLKQTSSEPLQLTESPPFLSSAFSVMQSLALQSQVDNSPEFSSDIALMLREELFREWAIASGRRDFNALYYRSYPSNLLSLVLNFPADHELEDKAEKAWRLSGGAIFKVKNVEQARLAEAAGASGIVVARRSPGSAHDRLIREINQRVSIPVMARARVGNLEEARTLEQTGSNFIYESELGNIAEEDFFMNKRELTVPCVCGCSNLGDAMRRIGEGAAMIRIQGEWSRPDYLSKTLKNVSSVLDEIGALIAMEEDADALFAYSERIKAPLDIVLQTKTMGCLPVPLFAAGGIANTKDAELLITSGCDGVFVDSKIFNCGNPLREMSSIMAVLNRYRDGQTSWWRRHLMS